MLKEKYSEISDILIKFGITEFEKSRINGEPIITQNVVDDNELVNKLNKYFKLEVIKTLEDHPYSQKHRIKPEILIKIKDFSDEQLNKIIRKEKIKKLNEL